MLRIRPSFLLAIATSLALAARSADAQRSDTTARASGATISGIVRDSLARAPLSGALVQLVAADGQGRFSRTVSSDSTGRYAIDGVPAGRYTLGFLHPMLDSLGMDPPLRSVLVGAQRAVRADLAIPSAATLRAVICGERTGKDSGVVVQGGALVGIVRDSRALAAAAGATVSGEWLEMSFKIGSIDRRRPRLVVTTEPNGYFALCNVPIGGTMFLLATSGADSTDMITVDVPPDGFMRRDLYLGSSRTLIVGDTVARADSSAPKRRQLRLGDGRLRGTVVAADLGRPIAGAQVRISEGPIVRADALGEWTVPNAPTGTRVLEIRAVGYYPDHRAVDVVAGAALVHASLSNFKAVLDTVKVIATLGPDRHFSNFEERRKSGVGRFFTADDLARRGVIETSDLFRNVPGVWLRRTENGTEIVMRSNFQADAMRIGNDPDLTCKPSVFLDGLQLFEASADEIDNAAPAKRVRTIEVYEESVVPPQFQRGLSGCGAIVIWMK